ncbi:MAG: hypothetical protein IRZ15_14095 [Bryobacteraceae bacterium]|nr:hypothetical protein [Bryobacteraceae bacterium]
MAQTEPQSAQPDAAPPPEKKVVEAPAAAATTDRRTAKPKPAASRSPVARATHRAAPPESAPASAPPKPQEMARNDAPAESLPGTQPSAPPIQSSTAVREPAPPPPPQPKTVTIAAGTLLTVRLGEGLSTSRNQPGDTFTAVLDKPLVVDGYVIAERGARVEGRVVEAERAGRVKGLSSLSIALTSLHTSDGQTLRLNTETFQKMGESSKKQDVAKVGIASGIGAAIGAIIGGGKGAGIGAAVGGAGGAGTVLATRGKDATLPVETRITFKLSEPVTVTEKLP